MSAPLYPERISCIECGNWLTFDEQRTPRCPCRRCVQEAIDRIEKRAIGNALQPERKA